MECKVPSVKCKVWSVKCKAWSVKGGVGSVKFRACNATRLKCCACHAK